jgi:sugar phosphate isomerase/epimerase
MRRGLALGCVEFAVPGATLEDKLRILESREMWLELVNDGKKRLKDVLNAQKSFGTSIESVQAYLLHELEMLGAGEAQRKAATRHVEDTIKLASKVGAKNVVTTITYGEPKIENLRKNCIELFRHFGELGEEFNVTVSIEPLGKDRTSFLPSVSEVHQLVQDVGSAHVHLMADTMHIHDNGDNVGEVVRKYSKELMELQLRDTGSRPPGLGTIDFDPVLKVVREKFRGLTCLEYRPGPDPSADFNHALKFVGGVISAAR